MKVLFLTDDLRIKHYHMACAIRDSRIGEPYLLHMKSVHFDAGAIIEHFPYPNRAYYYAKAGRAKFIGDLKGDNVFSSYARYSRRRLKSINPDVIYVSDLATIELLEKTGVEAKIVLDIEDSAFIDKETSDNQKAMELECAAMTHDRVDTILFGSRMELNWTTEGYGLTRDKCRVQYPYVAERTMPYYPDGYTPTKTDEFSIVYAGSLWSGGGYRDGFRLLEEIAQTGVLIDVFLLNSWNAHNWKILTTLAERYTNLRAFKRTRIQDLKNHIDKYHAGLCLSAGNYLKVAATWGMKPLEYAYAGVVPVAISVDEYSAFPIRNESNGREFGYVAEPDTIQKNFIESLCGFDWEYHMMDNHINEFSELIL